MPMKRVDHVELLRSLPVIIGKRDLMIATGMRIESARQALWRMTERKLIQAFAEDVFFNLLVEPNAPETHFKEALDHTLPRPKLMIGASALHEGGWTTQMPHQRELAVAVDRSTRTWKRMEGVSVEPRGREWFQSVYPLRTVGLDGVPVAPVAVALVDCIQSKNRFDKLSEIERKKRMNNQETIWHPDPDDITIDDDPEGAMVAIRQAVTLLKADEQDVADFVQQIDGLESYAHSGTPGGPN